MDGPLRVIGSQTDQIKASLREALGGKPFKVGDQYLLELPVEVGSEALTELDFGMEGARAVFFCKCADEPSEIKVLQVASGGTTPLGFLVNRVYLKPATISGSIMDRDLTKVPVVLKITVRQKSLSGEFLALPGRLEDYVPVEQPNPLAEALATKVTVNSVPVSVPV